MQEVPVDALIRGSPAAVTVATLSTFMPVSSATRSVASSIRSSWMMALRWSVEPACERSSSAWSAATSSSVSYMSRIVPRARDTPA